MLQHALFAWLGQEEGEKGTEGCDNDQNHHNRLQTVYVTVFTKKWHSNATSTESYAQGDARGYAKVFP